MNDPAENHSAAARYSRCLARSNCMKWEQPATRTNMVGDRLAEAIGLIAIQEGCLAAVGLVDKPVSKETY